MQPNAVTAIGEHADPAEATKLIVGAVGMVDLDAPPELERLRVFAGYAGWGPGQLDAELEAEGWILDEARVEDPFAEPTGTCGRRCSSEREASSRCSRGCRPTPRSTELAPRSVEDVAPRRVG